MTTKNRDSVTRDLYLFTTHLLHSSKTHPSNSYKHWGFSHVYWGNIGSVKAYLRADWIIEGILRDHYIVNGESQDRILVACFNPSIFNETYHKKGLYSFEEIYG